MVMMVMMKRTKMTRSPPSSGLLVLMLGLLQLHLRAHVHGASPTVESEASSPVEAGPPPGHATLNDMFREVEKLMEDTQHKLEEAVYKMDNESAKSMLYPHELPPPAQDRSPEQKAANESGHRAEMISEVNNSTVATHFSKTLVQPDGRGNEIDRECLIDEDCPPGNYCLYEVLQSRCLPCKALHTTCTKDEECCSGQLCLWGQCSDNGTKGEAGSICQYQSDCSPELCCAFHKALLFPVCTGRPAEHERCHSPSNHLMELLSWDMDGEGPREYCPCSRGLQCQRQGRGSLCLRPQNSSSEELADPLYSEDYIV